MKEQSDELAVHIGNQASRVAAAIDRHQALSRPALAQDLIGALAVNSAVLCVEVRGG